MSESDSHSALIRGLAADLAPVKRLRPPLWRALGWVAVMVGFAAILYVFPRHLPFGQGGSADSYTMAGFMASAVTAILAAIAAFQLSLPDRSSAWGLLPLPALLVWLAATGLGCLEALLVPGAWGTTMIESGECLLTILGISLPLSVVLVLMLRRAAPLRPNLVALVAGLAVAGAASTLLIFVHPHESAVLDLVAHLLAVVLVIGANVALGGRLLARDNLSRPA